jgi:hypothetical protein
MGEPDAYDVYEKRWLDERNRRKAAETKLATAIARAEFTDRNVVALSELLTEERARADKAEAALREAVEVAVRNATDCAHLRQSCIAMEAELEAARALVAALPRCSCGRPALHSTLSPMHPDTLEFACLFHADGEWSRWRELPHAAAIRAYLEARGKETAT